MKKIVLFFWGVILLFMCQNTFVLADNSINVFINSEKVSFDTEPMVVDNRTFVPMRAVCEQMGADVYWFDDYKVAVIIKNDTKIILGINTNEMEVIKCRDFEYFIETYAENLLDKRELINYIEMDTEPFIYDGRILLPIRYVCEALGAEVRWNSITSNIDISLSQELAGTSNKDIEFFDKWCRYLNDARIPTSASNNEERVCDAITLMKAELRGAYYMPFTVDNNHYWRITNTRVMKKDSYRQEDIDCIVWFSAETDRYDGNDMKNEYLIAFYKDNTCGIVSPYSYSFGYNEILQDFGDKYNQTIYIPNATNPRRYN